MWSDEYGFCRPPPLSQEGEPCGKYYYDDEPSKYHHSLECDEGLVCECADGLVCELSTMDTSFCKVPDHLSKPPTPRPTHRHLPEGCTGPLDRSGDFCSQDRDCCGTAVCPSYAWFCLCPGGGEDCFYEHDGGTRRPTPAPVGYNQWTCPAGKKQLNDYCSHNRDCCPGLWCKYDFYMGSYCEMKRP